MSTAVAEYIECPKCEAKLRISDDVRPSFCLQCRFPVMLVADKYQLVKILGEGGFGTVYEASHIHLTRDPRRVIKVLKPELLNTPTMRDRFAREVQVTSALSQRNHHIVRVFDDFGELPNLGLFYVMEYLEGQELSALLEEALTQDELLPLERCFHFFEQLCLAMHDAHEEGIIHRDLKPENILIVKHLRDKDHLKVIDFGIARPTEPNKKITNFSHGMLGTPVYMAPEQLSQVIGDHVDIYAMGVILFEMLVGHPPFASADGTSRTPAEIIAAKLMEDPPRVDQVAPAGRDISAAMADFVTTCLARNLDERFASVEALERAFKQASQEPVIPEFFGGMTLDDGPDPNDPSQTQDLFGDHSTQSEDDDDSPSMFATLPFGIDIDINALIDRTPTNAVALRPAHSDEGLPFSVGPSPTMSEASKASKASEASPKAPNTPAPIAAPPPEQPPLEVLQLTRNTPTPTEAQQVPQQEGEVEEILILSPQHRTPPPIAGHPKQPSSPSWISLQSVDIDPDMFVEDETGPKSMRSQNSEAKKRVWMLLLLLCTLGLAATLAVQTLRDEGFLPKRTKTKERIVPIRPAVAVFDGGVAEKIPADTNAGSTPRRPAARKRHTQERRRASKSRKAHKKRKTTRRKKLSPRQLSAQIRGRFAPDCPKDKRYYWLGLRFDPPNTKKLRIHVSNGIKKHSHARGVCLRSRTGKGHVTIEGRRRGTYTKCSFPFKQFRPHRILKLHPPNASTHRRLDYCARP